jgi:hypothetical protein
MFKFINDRDNAPSFHTASFDFDQDVDYSFEISLTTHVNLACTEDNTPVIYLNSFGLGYKHIDKFSISVVEGNIAKHITKKDPQNDGQADFFYLSSPTGKIKISDSFKDAFISWEKNDNNVQITTSDDDSVIIDFQKGVIDPNIKQYIDFLLQTYESAPHLVKPSMWKKILDLRYKFGFLYQ